MTLSTDVRTISRGEEAVITFLRSELGLPIVIFGLLIVLPIAGFAVTRRHVKTGSKLVKTFGWIGRIVSLVPWVSVVSVLVWLGTVSPDYDPDVTKWIEVEHPKDPHFADVNKDFEFYQWIVCKRGDKIHARLVGWREILKWLLSSRPFAARVDHLSHYKALHVDDGWLIGFNEGEFGAALYWFSSDGFRKYKISDDQVVAFMKTPQGIIAIQGLAHMGINEGSVIRLSKDATTGRWKSTELKRLPQAPQAFVRLHDGRIFIVLYESLVMLTPDNQLKILAESANWLSPGTIVVLPDVARVYVGTVPYVCEINMQTNQLRYLVPDASMAQRLSKP